MINTDTRQLKRREDGTYTSGAGKIPCDHCAVNQTCQLKPRTACAIFVPSLPFQDETGLQELANTVRVGVAWANRLTKGQAVALYNARTKLIFGIARVRGMKAGPIDDMLKRHAHFNHLMLAAPREEAADLLYKWQRQNYGPRIIHDKTRITAIYLQRLTGEDAAAYLEGHEALRAAESGTASAGQDHGDGDGNQVPGH